MEGNRTYPSKTWYHHPGRTNRFGAHLIDVHNIFELSRPLRRDHEVMVKFHLADHAAKGLDRVIPHVHEPEPGE